MDPRHRQQLRLPSGVGVDQLSDAVIDRLVAVAEACAEASFAEACVRLRGIASQRHVDGANWLPAPSPVASHLDAAARYAAVAVLILSRMGDDRPVTTGDVDGVTAVDVLAVPQLHLPLVHIPHPTSRQSLVETYPGQAATVLAFAREHFLEGVVVKRADSLYRSCRSTAWQKFKIRHPERVWVTAWIPGGPGEPDRYWVGREVRGTLVPSGEVSYGLTPGQASTLRRVLHAADLGSRGRQGLRPVAPVVAMTVAAHGRRSGWLRDPVITAVHLDPSGP